MLTAQKMTDNPLLALSERKSLMTTSRAVSMELGWKPVSVCVGKVR